MADSSNERRRMQRCVVEEPVTVKFWDHGPREITALVQNASPDGIFLQTDRELPEHSRLELVFLFPATLRSPGVRFMCTCRMLRRESPLIRGKFGFGLSIVRTESERIVVNNALSEPLGDTGLVLADS